jgi:DNA replication protein DnaC
VADVADQDFFAVLAELASEKAPTAEEAARANRERARHQRDERMTDRAQFQAPAVTAADREAIVAGNLRLQTHSLATVQAWLDRYQGRRPGAHVPMVVLYGPKGVGKTVAGSWLIAEEGGLYVSALQLCKRLISGHWRDTDWAIEVLGSRAVVLDDVGTEPRGEDAVAALYEFVNRRQALGRGLTLITTNLTRAEFAERYGERTVDKIMHSGRFVEAKGNDLRSKQS